MWPMLLDYTDNECRRLLRKLELEAYAAIVSAFRAQGELSKEKRKMLQDLSSMLSISMDRHKAEIRRATNSESLNTIADRLCGPNTSTDWQIEGRRVVPLMPRLGPETAFSVLANIAADLTAIKNESLPSPSSTGFKLENEIVNGDDDEEDVEEEKPYKRSLKRSLSPESSGNSEKIFALDSAAMSTTSAENMDEDNSDIITHSNSPDLEAPNDIGSTSSRRASSPVTKSTIIPLSKVINSSVSSSTSQKLVNAPISKVSLVTLPSVNVPPGKSNFTNVIPQIPAGDNEISYDASSADNSASSVTTFTTGASTVSSPLPISIATPPRSKVILTSKPTTLRQSSSTISTSSTTMNYHTSICHQPVPGVLQKTVTPYKHNSPLSSSSVTSTPVPCQMHNSLTRAQSPVAAISKVVASTTTTSNPTSSPIILKQATMQPNKTTCVPKMVTKLTPLRATGPRGMVAAITKPPPIHKCATTVMGAAPPVRHTMPLTVRNSTPGAQLLTGTKTTSAIAYSSKILPSPCQVRPLVQPMTKAIRYRNDGVVTGTARIVNLTQPVSGRLTRALTPTSLATVSLVNSLPVSGLRVAVPLTGNNTSIVRGTIPAKPNVIVVHKAQVWPQAPGATIVMTSTGSLSRLSTDVFEEAVTLMQRQDAAKPSGSATLFKTTAAAQPGNAQTITNQQIKVNQTITRKASNDENPLSTTAASTNTPPADNKKKILNEEKPKVNIEAATKVGDDASSNEEKSTATKTRAINEEVTLVEPVKLRDDNSIQKDASSTSAENHDAADNDTLNDLKLIQQNLVSITTNNESVVNDNSKKSSEQSDANQVSENSYAKSSSKNTTENSCTKIKENNVKQPEDKAQESTANHESIVLEIDDDDEDDDDDSVQFLSPDEQLSSDEIELLHETRSKTPMDLSDDENPASPKNNKSDKAESDSEHDQTNSIVILNEIKVDSTDSSDVAPTELGHLNIDEPCDPQVQDTSDCKPDADPFLKSDAESHSSKDVFLHAADSSDAEASDEVTQSNNESELNSLQAIESLGDSPASQSSPGALMDSNEDVEMEDLDNGSLNLNLSPDNTND